MSEELHISSYDGLAGTDGKFATSEMKATAQAHGLPRWTRCIHASVPLLKAARAAVAAGGPEPKSMGILSVGGPLCANHTANFLKRVRAGAPDHVNPLDFPHTLNSALPSVIAQCLGAHACALVYGDHDTPMQDVLGTARQLLTADLARSLLITVSSERPLERAIEGAIEARSTFDLALVFLATLTPHGGSVRMRLASAGSLSAREATILHEALREG